jgi:tetratricopeptide (TPR) repeat protein
MIKQQQSSLAGSGALRCSSILAPWLVALLPLVLSWPASAQDDLAKLYSEALKAQASGDLETASARYEAIIRLRPQMAEAYANLGNARYQQGQLDPAKVAYTKAVQLKPELAGPHFFLGVIAFGEHDYSSALQYLQRADSRQPSDPLILSYLGYTLYARSDFAGAARELEKAASLNALDIDLLYHLSKSYGHLAENSFAKLQHQFPNSAYVDMARAHVAETKEDWVDAEKQYTLALKKMPDNPRLQQKVRWVIAKTKGIAPPTGSAAIDEIVDAPLAPKDTPLSGVALRGEIKQWQSKVSALEHERSSDRNVYLLGEGYRILSYYYSLSVFDLDSNSYRGHQLRAQLLEESNNDDGAIQEYREALKQKPDLQNIHFAIGSLYWKDQQFDSALPELKEELRINPNHPQALYELGDIYAFNGNVNEAETYFLKTLKLQPGSVEAHLALEKIYTQGQQYEKSIDQLRSVLRIRSNDATAHYRLAVLYRKLGRTQEADRELALFNQHRAEPGSNAQSGSSIVK